MKLITLTFFLFLSLSCSNKDKEPDTITHITIGRDADKMKKNIRKLTTNPGYNNQFTKQNKQYLVDILCLIHQEEFKDVKMLLKQFPGVALSKVNIKHNKKDQAEQVIRFAYGMKEEGKQVNHLFKVLMFATNYKFICKGIDIEDEFFTKNFYNRFFDVSSINQVLFSKNAPPSTILDKVHSSAKQQRATQAKMNISKKLYLGIAKRLVKTLNAKKYSEL